MLSTDNKKRPQDYWYLHSSGCRNTLIYAHTNSRILPTCHISLGSLTVGMPEAGDFVGPLEPYLVGVTYNNVEVCPNFRQSRSVSLTAENEQTHTNHILGGALCRRYAHKHTFFPFWERWQKCLTVCLSLISAFVY